jgi:Tol biopolymer transport system component
MEGDEPMTRCRRTQAIAEAVADPGLGIDSLSAEQLAHVGICADCHLMVRDLDRLDVALTRALGTFVREDLPISVLATPAIPRHDPPSRPPAMFLAAAAVVVLAVGAVAAGGTWLDGRIGLGPDPPLTTSTTPAPSASPSAEPPSSPEPAPTPAVEPAPPVALDVGALAAVVDEPLVVRTEPGTEPDTTITDDRLWLGQRVRILDGPVQADGYTWWDVQVGEIRGWVADGERDGSAPWLSPIGNGRIAYADQMSYLDLQILTIDPDGGEATILVDLDASAVMRLVLTCGGGATPGGWTHDGARLAFDYAANGCDRNVGYVSSDGTGVVDLGPGSGPVWRPDGGAMTWAENVPYQPCAPGCDEGADRGPWELVHLEMGGEPAALTGGPAWTQAFSPAWAPDRETIVFTRWAPTDTITGEGIASIHVADADGSNPRVLTEGQDATWSPDGHWILFTRYNAETGVAELFRIRPDGSGQTALGEAWGAAYSPDGSRLAIARPGGLFTMAPDGTGSLLAIEGTTVDGFDWSPDGRHLVAGIDYGGNFGLYRVTLGGEAPMIVGLGQEGAAPSWQPLLLDRRLAE